MGELGAIRTRHGPGPARPAVRVHEAVLGAKCAGRPGPWWPVLVAVLRPGATRSAATPATRWPRRGGRRRRDPAAHDQRELAQVIRRKSRCCGDRRRRVSLWRVGGPAVLRRADALGFGEGATWKSNSGPPKPSDRACRVRPVHIFSADTSRGPARLGVAATTRSTTPTGELLGIVDVRGGAPRTRDRGMVETGVGSESQLGGTPAGGAGRGPRHIVGTNGGPLNHRGRTTAGSRTTRASPRGTGSRARATPPAVPRPAGLPERLDEGWIVRTAGPELGIRRGWTARGRGCSRCPGDTLWRDVPMTRRHPELTLGRRGRGRDQRGG